MKDQRCDAFGVFRTSLPEKIDNFHGCGCSCTTRAAAVATAAATAAAATGASARVAPVACYSRVRSRSAAPVVGLAPWYTTCSTFISLRDFARLYTDYGLSIPLCRLGTFLSMLWSEPEVVRKL
jgi:hypothetical protein